MTTTNSEVTTCTPEALNKAEDAWMSIRAPEMDVRDEAETVRVTVDLPGVDEQHLDINVENGVLSLEGRARVEGPAGYERVLGEFDAVVYRRTLRLSDRLDAGRIKASLKQGVLQLTVAKREETKAHRVAINAA